MSMVARYSFNKYSKNGWNRILGYLKLGKYRNKSKPYLPRGRKYKKYDAAGYLKGQRGDERFVVQKLKFFRDRVYYTNSHYKSWRRVQ